MEKAMRLCNVADTDSRFDRHESESTSEHICYVISDKKYRDGCEKKKDWLKTEFKNGYTFQKMDSGVAISSDKKRPFMSDPKFLKYQGFEIIDEDLPFFLNYGD